MSYQISNDGIYNLDFSLSRIEKDILDSCCEFLENKGLKYLSIPSTITYEAFLFQNAVPDTFSYGENNILSGSAEQGILQYFSNSKVDSMKIYSENTCFRIEDQYEGLKRVKEFKKVEQFAFCKPTESIDTFDFLLCNAIEFLESIDITNYRLVDVTKTDFGYHKHKIDIEVWTEQYGWLETHSCSYFGEEQSRRFNITGSNHTVSNTGIATPRILIPIMEKMKG